MKITFKLLHLSNFLSFEDSTFDFSNKGYTFVQGVNHCVEDNSSSNGSGKSSIWDAISWCLTGETIRGTKEVQRIGATSICEVQIVLEIDTDTYSIKRCAKPSKLQILHNNEDISGKGIRDTEKILSERIPDLTSDLLGSVIILGQGLPQRFTRNTPSGRKDILEKLSKSSFMIEDIKSRITKRKTELNNKLRTFEDNLITQQTLLKSNENNITEKTELLKNIPGVAELDSNIEELNSSITNLRMSYNINKLELDSWNNQLSDINAQITTVTNDSQLKQMEISNNLANATNNIKYEIQICQSQERSLTTEINRLKNIKDVCPTCGQKLQGVVKPDTTNQENELVEVQNKIILLQTQLLEVNKPYQDALQAEKNTLSTLISDLNKRKSKLVTAISRLTAKNQKLDEDIKYNEAKINNLNIEKAERQSKIDLYNTIIDTAQSHIQECEENILYINTEIDNLNAHTEVINKMDTIVKRDFRGYLLNNIIKYIDTQAKIYCKDVFNTDKVQFILDGNNISISYNGKEYECLSGGEKQKVDIIIQFSIRDMLCKYLNFSSNILVLDEITDNLDSIGCQNMFNLISNKLKDVENIYIISHHTDLQFPIDYQWIIYKGVDGISRLQE